MAEIKIKNINLQNFKSYGNETITDLNDKMNIIVGKNGHGKSNIHHGKISIFFWSFVKSIEFSL